MNQRCVRWLALVSAEPAFLNEDFSHTFRTPLTRIVCGVSCRRFS